MTILLVCIAQQSFDMLNVIFPDVKSGVIEQLESWGKFKTKTKTKDQKKTDGSKRQRLTGIIKLDDVNDARTKNSDKCTLI